MKRIVLPIVLLMFTVRSFSQSIYGFETGGGIVTSYGKYYTPAFEATYLKMILPHIYIGGAIDWRYFSFMYSDPLYQYSDPNYGDIIMINHHSSYLFLSPLLDLSIGENQFIHLNCNIGPGFYLGGSELTTYETNTLPTIPVYNYISTTGHNNKVIYQYGYGISEYIPTKGYWSIKLSQQYSKLGRDLNSNYGNGPALRTNYYSFTIGISHYYNKIFY